MTPFGMRPLLLDAAGAGAERACTDGDAHRPHGWTDGRRAWSCRGRAGEHDAELAEVVVLELAG